MKKSTIFKMTAALAILFVGYANSWGQELANPDVTNFRQHGTNNGNTVVATENTDSITVSAVMRYWAQPDPAVANAANTYAWTITPALGSQTGGTTTNIATVTFGNAPATGTIQVVETAVTGTCPGSTRSIPVEVIAKPTATGGSAPTAQCSSNPGLLTFAVPITTSTGEVVHAFNTVRVNFTVFNPDNSQLIAAQDIELVRGATTFNVTLTGAVQYGNYKVTINSVSDRISRKSAVAGTITTPDILLAVNRIPVTGPIYHLPNN